MNWWVLGLAVVLVAGLVPLLARVRDLASLRMPSRIERRPAPVRLQAAVDDMLKPIENELSELGFRFSHAAEQRGTPRALSPWRPVRVYRHHHYPMLAQMTAPGPVELPNMPAITMLGQVREGIVVATTNLPWTPLPPDPLVTRMAGEAFAGVREQFDAQLAAMHSEGLPDFLPWGDAEDIETRLTRHENRSIEACIEQGWYRPDGEMLCIAPRRLPALALRSLGRLRGFRAALRRWPADAQSLKTQAPLERGLLVFVAGKAAGRASPPPAVQWALYAASCGLLLLVAAVLFGFPFSAALLAVVALHEAGRYLAMRAFGYRRMQLLPMPLTGGMAFGEESRPNAWQRAAVGLAGPAPGLLLGLGLLWNAAPQSDLALLAWLLVLVNGLTLLPFHPLDGGRVLDALLPLRRAPVQVGLEVLAWLGLAALWWLFDIGQALLLLGALRVLAWRPLWRQLRFERWYRRAAARAQPGDAKAVARLSFQLLDRLLPRRVSLAQRIRMVDQLLVRLRLKPLTGLRAGGVALTYAAMLALPLLAAPQVARQMQASFLSDAEKQAQALAEAGQRARRMSTTELARALETRTPPPAAASELALSSLAHRTGDALPDEARELYLASDGLRTAARLELYSVADIRPLRENRPRLASQFGKRLQELYPQQPRRVPMACPGAPERRCSHALDDVLAWFELGTLRGQPLLLHPEHASGRWRLVMLHLDDAELVEQPPLRDMLRSQLLALPGAASAPR